MPSDMPSPASKLLAWYRKNGRKLPWRETQDPYRILVSELMLQQTQVPRVLVFYPRWLKQFPSWKALATASNAEVISAWAGLGYNRRALMLRDIARQVVAHGVPKSEEEWRLLKGVGPYTAAALAAFSLHARTLPIDTNIRRVLGRVLLGKPFPDLKDDEKIQKKANTFLPTRVDFHDVPQALFDLATLVCTKTPACATCPLRNDCPAAKKFLSGKIITPKRTTKKPVERIHTGKKYPDRIYRGRILKAVRENVTVKDWWTLGDVIDPAYDVEKDEGWLEAMIGRLVDDGLLARKGTTLRLPE